MHTKLVWTGHSQLSRHWCFKVDADVMHWALGLESPMVTEKFWDLIKFSLKSKPMQYSSLTYYITSITIWPSFQFFGGRVLRTNSNPKFLNLAKLSCLGVLWTKSNPKSQHLWQFSFPGGTLDATLQPSLPLHHTMCAETNQLVIQQNIIHVSFPTCEYNNEEF